MICNLVYYYYYLFICYILLYIIYIILVVLNLYSFFISWTNLHQRKTAQTDFLSVTSDFKIGFPQVNTGAQSNATLCIWVCPCWRPSGGIQRRPRQWAPWPPSLWLTATPLTKGEAPKISALACTVHSSSCVCDEIFLTLFGENVST